MVGLRVNDQEHLKFHEHRDNLAAYLYPMNILNTGGLTAEQAEALFNLANNGVLTRIGERG